MEIEMLVTDTTPYRVVFELLQKDPENGGGFG